MAASKKKVPARTAHNPSHYHIEIRGQRFQVYELMEALFPQDMHLSQAFKYLMRAGRKADNSWMQDIGKAVWWLMRGMVYRGAKVIEAPPGANIKQYED